MDFHTPIGIFDIWTEDTDLTCMDVRLIITTRLRELPEEFTPYLRSSLIYMVDGSILPYKDCSVTIWLMCATSLVKDPSQSLPFTQGKLFAMFSSI